MYHLKKKDKLVVVAQHSGERGQSSLHIKFQESQEHTEKLCLKNQLLSVVAHTFILNPQEIEAGGWFWVLG